MKKLFLKSAFFLIIAVCFNSCENQEINEQEIEQTNMLNFKSSDLSVNILEYINIDQNLNDKIEEKLRINKNFKFGNDIIVKLQNCKSLEEITKLFKNGGVSNSTTILSLLEEKVMFQKLFIKNNPQFYQISISERTTLVNELINRQYSVSTTKGNYETESCASAYNTSSRRCNRDAMIGSTAAIISAAAGLFPGVVAAAYVMIAHHNCMEDAMEDYQACI